MPLNLDIKYIKSLFTSDIFRRGSTYYTEGHVLEVIDKEQIIKAIVKGSEDKPYEVTILKTNGEEIASINCTCPYNRYCKHAAAALIYYLNHGTKTAIEKQIINPVLMPEKEQKELVFDIKERKNTSHVIEILNQYKAIIEIDNNSLTKSKERWKLIFCFVIDRFRYGNYEGVNNLKFTLGLMYIKKDGAFGRIIDFKREKLTEPIENEIEKKLFNSLIVKKDFRQSADVCFDFLLENKNLSVYVKIDNESYKAEYVEIRETIIDFKLHQVDYKEKYCTFHLLLTLTDEDGNKYKLDNKNKPYIVLDYLVYITDDGKILYKKTNNIYIEFINRIIDFILFYKEDIDAIKTFVKEYLKDDVVFNFNKEKIITRYSKPKPILEFSNEYTYRDINTCVNLCFNYNDREIYYKNTHVNILIIEEDNEINKNELNVVSRDKNFEKSVENYLTEKFKKIIKKSLSRFDYYYAKNDYDFILNIDIRAFLIEYAIPMLDEGYEFRFYNNKSKLSKSGGKVNITVTSGIDWFDVNTDYVYDNGEKLKNLIISKEDINNGLIQIADRFVILSKDDIEKLRKLLDEGMDEKGKLKISKLNFGVIESLYSIISNKDIDELKFAREIAGKLKNFEKIEKNILPQKFNGTLRDYQISGYNWLHFLHKYNLNGCLADDMGLGKTVQTLAFLQDLKEKKSLGLSLIIVPVTTVANWESEITRFTPELKFIRHHGQDRVKDKDFFNDYDIIISSYHTLRNDIEFFNDFKFDYLILDEAQNIKNHTSLIFKTVRIINSNHKLSLTGTPVENNTTELWSQLNFLNPSLLGSINDFKYKFVNPIEAYNDKEAAQRLRKIIYPFILRRKKEEVAKDLPEKEEIVVYCEMNSEQKKVYNMLREYYKGLIENTLEEKGIEKSAIQIFEALLRLRQAALFPSLVSDEYKDVESIKFETLKDLMEEIIEEKHKVLLFSQFVKSLKIIEDEVKRKNIKYSYIDGQTKKRDVQIKKFQEDDNINLFLLSLKAGGVGINLTAADYVILFDPWWNPAVETQAVDRSHRIGQTKKVMVYKLIVKDTVEEKILELQNKKKELVSKLITEEASFFKSLSKKDIMNLFD